MAQMTELIPVPLNRPPGVTPKQWRLAVLFPRAESAYQAMIQAGYKPVTALASAKRALGSVGIERATAALMERQRDRAREIDTLASTELVNRLQPEKVDQLGALELANIWGGARKVRNEYPETEDGLDDSSRSQAASFVRLVVRFALAAAKDHELTDHEIDVIASRSPQDLVVSLSDNQSAAK